ncbi:MAG: UDP-phosphate glucose phosphotransferase [Paenibacillaceae bacterium]|jgi:Undecaprenyl-phosphate glucose phosphotransferase|nr:UDP-phosphate glucose phosphotransferase [Paenibacillaceae bacterium]
MIRKNQNIISQLQAAGDFVVMQLVFLVAWWVKFESVWKSNPIHLPIKTYYIWSLVFTLITITIGFFVHFYTGKRRKRFSFEVFKIVQTQAISMLILLSILFVYKEIHISREFLIIFLGLNIVCLIIYRYIVKISLKKVREKGYNKQFVLIIGAGRLGKEFYNNLRNYPELGFEVAGFLDDYQAEHTESEQIYKPILGNTNELESIIDSILIDEVIIALPLNAHAKYGKIISICEKAGVRVMIIPDYYEYLPSRPYFDNFAGMPLINVRNIPLDDLGNRILKRGFDILFSLAAILITLPVMLLVAVIIKVTSPGPIIFMQERVGLNRRTFHMYKFRTMKVMPEGVSDTQWTVPNDPRRTAFGELLRKTSIDELPQFFNVLLGHMSVVGPRPERPFFVEQFREDIPKYMVKHHIRPGITGLAQSKGLRGDTSIKDRVQEDIFYIENWTLLFDIKIILRTIINGFVNNNAY